ncbi:MAG: hypothetical protein ACLGHN_02535 [Bacteriovoracia bacterium]
MRIILLTLLFLAPLYYFNREEKSSTPEIDSIKVKISAPDREERLLTTDRPLNPRTSSLVESSSAVSEESEEQSAPEVSSTFSDLEQAGEVELRDLEADWNGELKEMLLRLEPMDGEEIHRSYLQEQENYQSELNALLDEKQQKTEEQEIVEIEYMIGQLDFLHQERLKEILGAHYDAIRDHYDYFMESTSYEQ